MAEFKRLRKYDVSFVTGSATGDQLTNAINTRYDTLASSVGGTPYFEIQEVDLRFINKANPSHFTSLKNSTFTSELSTPKEVQSSHTRRASTNTTYNVPATSQYISELKSKEESETFELAPTVNQDDLTVWMLFITYDQIIQTG